MRTERIINIYSKEEGNPFQEVSINIPINKLKNIVSHRKHDPLLYEGYLLDKAQLNELNDLLENRIVPNHELYNYVLECIGIYDW